jgi:uncharacterized protein
MDSNLISQNYIVLIVTSIILGTIARILTLIVDYRQYPSFPNGYLIHLITGFIASALGAVAIPALLEKDFTAFTFLVLAIEQFREVRRIENESLRALDDMDYIYRGEAYIDGISKTFEARNYFSLIVSFTSALTIQIITSPIIWIKVLGGTISGTIVFLILRRFSKGKTVGDIADVVSGQIKVEGSELYVDDIFITNHLGSDHARYLVQNEGMAAVIRPRKNIFRTTLDNPGQRQAILFEVCRSLGIKRYHYTRKNYTNGHIAIVFVPIENDIIRFIEIIKKTPLLESVKKSPKVLNTNFIEK